MKSEKEFDEFMVDFQQFFREFSIDKGLDADTFKMHAEYHLEEAYQRFRLEWRTPGNILQDDKVVYRYPKNIWQMLKRSLGLKYKSDTITAKEIVVFPDYHIPVKTLKDQQRIYFAYQLYSGNLNDKDNFY